MFVCEWKTGKGFSFDFVGCLRGDFFFICWCVEEKLFSVLQDFICIKKKYLNKEQEIGNLADKNLIIINTSNETVMIS